MIAVKNASEDLPKLEVVDDYYVYLSGNHFQQDETNVFNIYNNIATNIYCVYKLDPISPSRDDTFTVQNALFGSMQITKNADTSKYEYKGYGVCFDEGSTFGKGNITNGRNVLIFGVHEIIKQITYLLWVMDLYKVLMIRLCMQKKYIAKILLNQTKSLC